VAIAAIGMPGMMNHRIEEKIVRAQMAW